jgi:arylsulfatase A-like enzyme
LNIARNTVVLFMSDNGGLATAEGYPTTNLPLRAGKGWLYEGGIREPMIIKWPGIVRAGSECAVPVISTDFYPTILEMAGLPLMPGQHQDGISLLPLLQGKQTLPRECLYWHYPHYGNQGGSPSAAIRQGDFKLIEFYEDNHVELYDLKDDPAEMHDLAVQNAEKARSMRQNLHQWQQGLGARMPTPNPAYHKNDSF